MVLYEKVKGLGAELFSDFPLEERKHKFECEVCQSYTLFTVESLLLSYLDF